MSADRELFTDRNKTSRLRSEFSYHELGHPQSIERAVFNGAPDGILLVNRLGRVLMANQAMEKLSMYSKEELLGQSVGLLLPEDKRAQHSQAVERYFANPTPRPMGTVKDLRLRAKNGQWVAVDISLGHILIDGHELCTVLFIRDVTDLRLLESQLHHQATHDALTGLPNRWQFQQQLTFLMAQSARHQRKLALILMDFDGFKFINDNYGHGAGDRVLVETAKRLQSFFRSSDYIARLGGDEFTIILPDIVNSDEAVGVLSRVNAVLSEPISIDASQVQVTTSMGVTFFPDDALELEKLLQHADMAMYKAKANGRNTYHIYSQELGQRQKELTQIQERLLHAMHNNLLELHYQPQIDIRMHQACSVEALLRWNDPVLGYVEPGKFIPIAEATGLITKLGYWVIEQACRQQKSWEEKGQKTRIAINISAQQLNDLAFMDKVSDIFRSSGVLPSDIEMEITESVAMKELPQTRKIFSDLADLGVRISLDDFGTGYSSLSQLKSLPVRSVKIDKSFMRNVPEQLDDTKLIKAIVAMAHTLGMEVVAEGVENLEQLEFLADCGCESFQGWLVAKAMPSDELLAWMHKFNEESGLAHREALL